jgi:DNA-binding transcriptional LysR family regulator
VDVQQRWTVTSMATSIGAVCRGYGFAWLLEDKIRSELNAGILKPLPLAKGHQRLLDLYLIFADREASGPGVHHLAGIFRDRTRQQCAQSAAKQ